jgi:threonine synthase
MNTHGLGIASTGNAAISLAAFALFHGLGCTVFVPEDISRERLNQIQAFNPIVRYAPGYEEAVAQCNEASEREHLLNCNPGRQSAKLRGDSEIGSEISTMKWEYVVVPTNNGTLLGGIWRGLKRDSRRTRMVAAVAPRTKLAEGIAGFHKLEEPTLTQALKNPKG